MRPTAVLSHDRSERTTVPNASQGWFGLRGRRAALWVFSGFAVIVIAIAAAALFLLLGSDGPSVSAPISVGTPPLRITADGQGAWVTSERDGTVTRLDPGER